MKCEACLAGSCDACTGVVYVERNTELPCACPDSRHDSPRRIRKFTDEPPPVTSIQVINGVPKIPDDQPVMQSAYFWKETAEDLKRRFDRLREANEGNMNSRRKLKRKLGSDE